MILYTRIDRFNHTYIGDVMTEFINQKNLQISPVLYEFIEQEVLPDLPIDSQSFWPNVSALIDELMPINKSLLEKREELQQKIDLWHKSNKFDLVNYKSFLTEIGYLVSEPKNTKITTNNVDVEISKMAGPQLVVPITNARFALNAVNARWGSLYDALYGTDVIPEHEGAEKSGEYNPVRGLQVIQFGREFLDINLPLCEGSHSDVIAYKVDDKQLKIQLKNNTFTSLQRPEQLLGFQGDSSQPSALAFEHNQLKFELIFDSNSAIAKTDTANISDIVLESALTTIMDCEDSVATVDAQDKVLAYRNWLGLNQGTLSAEFKKNGKTITRSMAQDKLYSTVEGDAISLRARSLMFVRNVGHLMTNNMVLNVNGEEVYEGLIDAIVTSLIALHSRKTGETPTNSKYGSIYIVKPKMHGPEEVAFTNLLFSKVEQLLSLPKNTIKMGIMDEERRTSVNLLACIEQAKSRVVFINTGFLDRTGDEIHTSMQAGIIAKKADIKSTKWLTSYEKNNVIAGLVSGFKGNAQIGKGMWPIPDQMANMLSTKIAHAKSGANTAWVPSPTAATLHALHYHQVSVGQIQQKMLEQKGDSSLIDNVLTIDIIDASKLSQNEIEREIDNNVQGLLGYVVRWVNQGIGCSKVPDINNIGLMEDRATLRISSQHLCNWLTHNVCSKQQVEDSLEKMAKIVDQQNAEDPLYQPLSTPSGNSFAMTAAKELIFEGLIQPSGYTEPLLHKYRLLKKATLSSDE